jgi:hypothetical protein
MKRISMIQFVQHCCLLKAYFVGEKNILQGWNTFDKSKDGKSI